MVDMFLVLFSILLQWGSNVLVQSTRFNGGFPLLFPGPCPSGLAAVPIAFSQNCCAANLTFVQLQEAGVYCCPRERDCSLEVPFANQCVDPSWQLCEAQGRFCCLQDWTCYKQDAVSYNGSGVGCSAPGATLNSLQTKLAPLAGAVDSTSPVTSSPSQPGATSVATTNPLDDYLGATSPLSSPSSASATATVSRGSVTAQITTPPLASPSAIRPTTSSGLNAAERIGIGVGVSLGFLFLIKIALLGCVLYRGAGSLSTRKKGKNDQVPADFGDSLRQRPDLDEVRANGSTSHVPGQARPMREVPELEDTCPYPRELQGSLVPYGRELQGSHVPYRRELA
ncbi:hypothetical protein BDR22DRAFT_969732 [Usnea florida]